MPWKRNWQPTPVFLPGEFHSQRSLVGYSPWGHKRVGHDSTTKQQQQPVVQWLRLCFHYRGHEFDPWSGNMPHSLAKIFFTKFKKVNNNNFHYYYLIKITEVIFEGMEIRRSRSDSFWKKDGRRRRCE